MLDDIDHLLDEAIASHQARNFNSASAKYLKILEKDASHADTNHNFGLLKVELGLKEEALIFLQTAINTNPNVLQYWITFINTLTTVEQFDDARAVLDQAHLFGHKDETLNHLKHNLDLAQMKYETLIKPNQLNASKSDRHQTNILSEMKLDKALKLAKKKVINGLNEEAKKIYKDILVKFPGNKKAKNGLGDLAGMLSSFDKVSKDQDPPQGQQQYVIKLYHQGQLKQSLQQVNILLQQFPNSSILYNISGVAYRGLDQLDASIKSYEKALSIKPDFAEACYNMGNALRDQGKLNEALEAYTKAISIKPDYADAYNNMAVALKKQGKLEEAIEAYTEVLAIKPDYADAYFNIGNAFQIQDKLEEAIEAFTKAISIKPDYADAYNNMAVALKKQGKLEEAIEAYNNTVSINPDHWTAKHMLSALTGNKNSTAPREYVENLFDGYSKRFETSLVHNLEYKIPKLIRDILIKPNSNESLGSVLDLGCGTGLFGFEIRDHCSQLEGIDLSNRMLELAKQKNVYDKLSQSDIVEYISNKPLDFDYYIALDVFVYVGELTEIFQLIRSRNKKTGHLVFSTEHTELDGYHILKTGRYSHSKTYVENLCKEFGYKISHFSTTNLRKEKEHFLTGGVYVLEFGKEI